MKAFVIDPAERQIVNFDHGATIVRHVPDLVGNVISAPNVAFIGLGNHGDTLWHNARGMTAPGWQGFFGVALPFGEGAVQVIAGGAMVIGQTGNGTTRDVLMTLEDLTARITWLDEDSAPVRLALAAANRKLGDSR